MSRDTILLSLLVAGVVAAGVLFFLFRQDEGDSDFVPADERYVEEPASDQPSVEARRAPTTEAPARSGPRPGMPGASSVAEVATSIPTADTATIIGRVIDPGGRPVPEAYATLCIDISDVLTQSIQGDIKLAAMTDRNGSFEMKGIPVDDRYVLRVDDDEFASNFVQTLKFRRGERRKVTVRLSRGLELEGTVTDTEGSPIPEVEILVFDQQNRANDPDLDIERRMFTDGNGAFKFSNLNPGFKRVTARKDGFGSVTEVTVNVMKSKPTQPLQFKLGPGSHIVGRVLDATSQEPLVGAVVSARPIRTGVRNTPIGNYPSVKTDEAGQFRYTGLPEGSYSLRVSARGYGRMSKPHPAKTGEDEVHIEVQRKPVARGRVVDAETGEPVKKFSIMLSRGESLVFASHRLTQRFEDENGEFEYLDLEHSGEFYLFGLANGYAGGRSEKLRGTEQDVEGIVIRMTKGATAKGRITNAKGQGVAGASVRLVPQIMSDGGQAQIFIGLFQKNMKTASKSTRTDKDGNFVLEQVAAGNFKLNASHEDYAAAELKQEIVIPDSGEVTCPTLALTRGGTVRGVVTDDDGNPSPSAKVQLSEKGAFGGQSYYGFSDASGKYEITNVRPGIYTVEVVERNGEVNADIFSKLFNRGELQEIVIGDGEVQTVNLD